MSKTCMLAQRLVAVNSNYDLWLNKSKSQLIGIIQRRTALALGKDLNITMPQALWGVDCVMKCIDVKFIVIVFRGRHYRLGIVQGCGGGCSVHIFGLSPM